MTCPVEADTVLIDISRWSEPVNTLADLAVFAPDGQLCFVQAEDRSYIMSCQEWQPVDDTNV